jgi:amino acid transporter
MWFYVKSSMFLCDKILKRKLLMSKLTKIFRLITILGIILPLIICGIYLLAISFKFGQFPPDLSDSKWRPLPFFRPIVDGSLIVMGFSIFPYLTTLVILLIRGWRPSKPALILEGLLILSIIFFIRSNFVTWFLD